MRLDSLARLIESSDFASFREIALRTLKLRGYRDVSLTDGWSDGGTDFRIFDNPPNPTKVAVQISVEKDWRTKVRTDSLKAKTKLGLHDMLFVSPRRLAESEFQKLAEEIWAKLAVRVNRIDGQGIASTFFAEQCTGEVLSILGISPSDVETPTGMPKSARFEAAFSFVFFGKESEGFREKMIESAIIATVAHSPAAPAREAIEDAVSAVLSLEPRKRTLVSGVLDRMLQRGDLFASSGSVFLHDRLAKAAQTMRTVRNSQWYDLTQKISTQLESDLGHPVAEHDLAKVMESLGSLILGSADRVSDLLKSGEHHSTFERLRSKLLRLHAGLDGLGFPEGLQRDRAIERLAEIAANSPIGKYVMAGELFITLSSAKPPHLIRALGARTDIRVILDTSVAIPILASLLYRPTDDRYFAAAHTLYTHVRTLALKMILPIGYLEEVASHLFLANEAYAAIVETADPDLAYSENAFVSHYVTMRKDAEGISFRSYLAGFGLSPSLYGLSLAPARDEMMRALEPLFARYEIETVRMYPARRDQIQAEESVARAIHHLVLERPSVVLQHDARVIAFLIEKKRQVEEAFVLTTWDNLHFTVRESERAAWDAIDPAALNDLLVLVSNDESEAPLSSLSAMAKLISDESASRGAAVWDVLAKIEKGKLFDAQLLEKAREFKREFLLDSTRSASTGAIRKAWATWKAKRMPSAPSTVSPAGSGPTRGDAGPSRRRRRRGRVPRPTERPRPGG